MMYPHLFRKAGALINAMAWIALCSLATPPALRARAVQHLLTKRGHIEQGERTTRLASWTSDGIARSIHPPKSRLDACTDAFMMRHASMRISSSIR